MSRVFRRASRDAPHGAGSGAAVPREDVAEGASSIEELRVRVIDGVVVVRRFVDGTALGRVVDPTVAARHIGALTVLPRGAAPAGEDVLQSTVLLVLGRPFEDRFEVVSGALLCPWASDGAEHHARTVARVWLRPDAGVEDAWNILREVVDVSLNRFLSVHPGIADALSHPLSDDPDIGALRLRQALASWPGPVAVYDLEAELIQLLGEPLPAIWPLDRFADSCAETCGVHIRGSANGPVRRWWEWTGYGWQQLERPRCPSSDIRN